MFSGAVSYSRHILQSVEIPAVTQARASDDYHSGLTGLYCYWMFVLLNVCITSGSLYCCFLLCSNLQSLFGYFTIDVCCDAINIQFVQILNNCPHMELNQSFDWLISELIMSSKLEI